MNTKIGVVILVLILAVVGWFSYTAGNKAQKTEEVKQQEVVFAASFVCEDNFRFIAEFTTQNEVRIIVDGDIVRTLPQVSGAGQRFEDTYYIYVFAGEEVSVTNKAAQNRVTVCRQPVDPNNAPINFGDAGEGSGVKQDASLVVNESIVGRWQSNEDAKFIREFKGDGVINDIYDGKVVSTGKWQTFTKEKPAPFKISFPVEANTVYIQLTTSGSQADTLNFKLTKLTPESLELIYMDRGNVNTFKRVK